MSTKQSMNSSTFESDVARMNIGKDNVTDNIESHLKTNDVLGSEGRQNAESADHVVTLSQRFYGFPPSDLASRMVPLASSDISDDFRCAHERPCDSFINIIVINKSEFCKSAANFGSGEVEKLVELMKNSQFNEISKLGGIFTWAEGSFRSKHTPEFHSHFRVCKYTLHKHIHKLQSAMLQGLHHAAMYTTLDIQYELVQRGNQDLTNQNMLNESTYLALIPNRDMNEIDSGTFRLIRYWDGMGVNLRTYYVKKEACKNFELSWYPSTYYAYRSKELCPKNWYRLPDNTSVFKLFGFDETHRLDDKHQKKSSESMDNMRHDRKYTNCNTRNNSKFTDKRRCNDKPKDNWGHDSSANNRKNDKKPWKEMTILEKSRLNNVCFLKLDDGKIKLTHDETQATLFTLEGKTLMTQSTGDLSRLISCPHEIGKINNQNIEDNEYFKEDLDEIQDYIKNLSNTKEDIKMDLSQLEGNVLMHPFLPIIGFLPDDSTDLDVVLKTILQRIKLLVKSLNIPERNPENGQPACEVVLGLHQLTRGNDLSSDVYLGADIYDNGIISPTHACVPGLEEEKVVEGSTEKKVMEDIKSIKLPPLQPRWKTIVAYCWLKPLSYYQCVLLDDKAGWLNAFTLHGMKFKVVS